MHAALFRHDFDQARVIDHALMRPGRFGRLKRR